ncbi:MAG: acyltransferase family protein [Pseudomonas oryzihabitans]
MLIQLNWIRGLAAVLIVFHHMTVGSYRTTEHQQIALNLLSLETTCIFVALSGFFFRLTSASTATRSIWARSCRTSSSLIC